MKLDKTLEYAPSTIENLNLIVGLDEVGRGCGAGPVVTAAVILPKGFSSPLLRDSKKLSEKQRLEAYQLIIENALAIECHAGSAKRINEIGINKSTFETMHKCLNALTIRPEHILIDGTVWDKFQDIPHTLVTKGDDTYLSIAAAAIIAKVRRDEYMTKLHINYPNYNWESNKGYLTKTHIQAIKTFGATQYHRNQYISNFV
jgi:ribonuclease HII